MRQCWYFMPHGITADHQGNIWLTDVAMHQVFKIPPGQTVPKMTLGQKFQHGEDTNLFCKPTDVAVFMSGEFFVSDGYCNSRVLKFSKDGTFLMSFGKRNVQFGAGGLLYAVNGPAFDGPIDTTVQGFTSDINTGDLLEMWNVPDNMRNPHYVAADPVTRSIYVGELDPESVWKFSRPVTVQSSSQHNKVEESTQSQLLSAIHWTRVKPIPQSCLRLSKIAVMSLPLSSIGILLVENLNVMDMERRERFLTLKALLGILIKALIDLVLRKVIMRLTQMI
ncbi:peptidyl-glycine alpha-amidating monooxygenase B-like [Biomphalaria glabrata]|uniref:peptidylamidoglycolate lyase n=1 Tax=Biomphalaria glabrata TaxID=6526 RepID=A0A9W3BDD3_BIOGL|nr:peptidyl-glycine alpha-amidating monooxygenase B-like [Biomphalaria glabrata]XP_055897450.1 peptidyl-glycine alpha-amidating monooxygenase B-like [Biomphalaria glabrata]XP_055897451.1 peptidyl-glycine alpha-amidating monooxygenase B-like [Biomphalaria glabrata]XP_055897452.1 peptidyl-glycine alpha-amidating monooxygenase B-like [Biomphalaria glabrata]XP_055897453.1 peptidyl-glycine alpha-amidating monooxygenase B-like [Biomphalaria glabrata]